MEKMEIDVEKFALAVVSKDKPVNITNEQYVKNNLLLYLEASIAARKFNELEENQFKNIKKKDIQKIVSDIVTARLT